MLGSRLWKQRIDIIRVKHVFNTKTSLNKESGDFRNETRTVQSNRRRISGNKWLRVWPPIFRLLTNILFQTLLAKQTRNDRLLSYFRKQVFLEQMSKNQLIRVFFPLIFAFRSVNKTRIMLSWETKLHDNGEITIMILSRRFVTEDQNHISHVAELVSNHFSNSVSPNLWTKAAGNSTCQLRQRTTTWIP